MAKIKDNKIIVLDNDGNEVECQVLFVLKSNETNKNYIVYSDTIKNNNDEYYIHIGSFDPTCKTVKIKPIKNDKEWNTVSGILQKLLDENDSEKR